MTDRERSRYTCILSSKLLIHIMSGNPFEIQANMALLASKDLSKKEKIVEIIKTRTKIDEEKGLMKIESY